MRESLWKNTRHWRIGSSRSLSPLGRGRNSQGKQAWHLEKAPQKTAAAVTAHVLMTFAVLALTTAYRLHEQALQDVSETVTAFAEGIRQWRRRMGRENQDKVIIFVGGKYGILHVAALAVLTGVRLRKVPPELGTTDDILRRYGVERGRAYDTTPERVSGGL